MNAFKKIIFVMASILFYGVLMTNNVYAASDCPGAEPSEILKEEPVGKNILPIKDIESCLGGLSGSLSFVVPTSLASYIGTGIEKAKAIIINAACAAANQTVGQYVSATNTVLATAIATASTTVTGATSGLVSGVTGKSALGSVVGGSLANSVNQAVPGVSGGLGLTAGSAVPAPTTPTTTKSWVW